MCGVQAYEAGSLEQAIVIPSTKTSLTFWLKIDRVGASNDYFRIKLDGQKVFQIFPSGGHSDRRDGVLAEKSRMQATP